MGYSGDSGATQFSNKHCWMPVG